MVMEKSLKKTKGRQKIEIKPIEVKSNLQVTFSKRRVGLMKKAGELSILCGADVAVLTFSPGQKAYAFGNPDVDSVIHRYLSEGGYSGALEKAEADLKVHEWKKEYGEILKDLEEEKKCLAMIEGFNMVRENKENANLGFWWDDPIENMDLEELEEYVRALKDLKSNFGVRVNDLVMANQYHLNHHQNNVNFDLDGDYGIGNIVLGGFEFGGGGF